MLSYEPCLFSSLGKLRFTMRRTALLVAKWRRRIRERNQINDKYAR